MYRRAWSSILTRDMASGRRSMISTSGAARSNGSTAILQTRGAAPGIDAVLQDHACATGDMCAGCSLILITRVEPVLARARAHARVGSLRLLRFGHSIEPDADRRGPSRP